MVFLVIQEHENETISIYNNFSFDVAAYIDIDGINVLDSSRTDPQRGKKLVVPTGQEVSVKGWLDKISSSDKHLTEGLIKVAFFRILPKVNKQKFKLHMMYSVPSGPDEPNLIFGQPFFI